MPPINHFLRCLLLTLLLGAAVAAAERDMKKEAAIEQELTALDAKLVPTFRNAREDYDAGKYAEAEVALRTVCDRVPQFDVAHRRRAGALAMLKRRGDAIRSAQLAVELRRNAPNLETLAYVSALADPSASNDSDRRYALKLLRESRALPDGEDAIAYQMAAQLAFMVEDLPEARIAVAWLERNAPDTMLTHYFAALIAAADEKWVRSENELRRAQKLGLPEAEVNRILDAGVGSRATTWRIIGWDVGTVATWLVGLTTLFLLGFALSWKTLRQIERADPTVAMSGGERSLRKIYRAVVNVAGVYYYISLPVVLILVLNIVAAIGFGCLLAGFIPIKLALILGIGALVTIWTMVQSLFLRVQSTEPGRVLKREEAERLWKLVEEVAADVNTRPVDEIRLTPGTELCVYERGTWREKMKHTAPRVLVIGTAVLPNFQQEHFRSVLAHEYGHFAHRDTAGGDIAFRVQRDIMLFYYAMRDAGQATYWNVAFHFLRMYNFLFRRITHGATRLQEVLADRVAAQTYGAAAFEGGLRHVVRQHLAFEDHANREINDAIRAKRPIQNLYAGAAPAEDSFEKKYEAAISRPTTADDTHPGPLDRFRLIARIPDPSRTPRPGLVWELFQDRAAIESEMTQVVEKNIAGERV